MHVQLSNANGYTWVIDCDNPKLVGEWFALILPKLGSSVSVLSQSRLIVTNNSSRPDEYKLTSSDLVSYYLQIKKIAEYVLELEMKTESDATSA